jgi:hypothetical protein
MVGASPGCLPGSSDVSMVFLTSESDPMVEGKGKVHPRTGHEGPEVVLMYSSTLSLTSALDGVGVKPRPGRFTPRKDPVSVE